MNLFPIRTETILLYVWVLARVSGLVVSMPVLSGKAVPVRIKGLIAVSLAFLIEPVVLENFVPPRLFSAWLGSLVVEFLVGVSLGFSAYLIFAAVSFAGEMAGVQVGFGLIDVINPLGLAEVPLLGTFQNTVAFLVFLASGTHEALIWALGRSYAVVGPGEGHFRTVFYEGYLGVFSHFMVLGLTLAAPFLVGGIVLNLAMGFLSRMMPQMNLISVGFPVLVLGGLGLLILSLPFLGSVLEEAFFRMEETLGGILKLVAAHGG